jgi:hypothetical protein
MLNLRSSSQQKQHDSRSFAKQSAGSLPAFPLRL